MGAGVAGASCALLLARDGHDVTVVDHDDLSVATDAGGSVRWDRKGVPHFLQPHAFLPRGRKELRSSLPDVYDALLDAGAHEIDLRAKISSEPEPADEELAFLGVR